MTWREQTMENNCIYIFTKITPPDLSPPKKKINLNTFTLVKKDLLTVIVHYSKVSQEEPACILSLRAFYTLYQRIWKFVPQRYCDFFFFLASPFMHAMKSAADCPYVTVYGMQVSRWEPVDYTLGTCCSLACLQCVFCCFFSLAWLCCSSWDVTWEE